MAVMRQIIDAINADDRERFKQAKAHLTVHKDLGTDSIFLTDESVTEWVWKWRQALPDLRGEITTCFASGEQGVLEVEWTGTHRGELESPLGAVPATGRAISIPGVLMCRVQDGKVVKSTHYFDLLQVLAQLGVTPPASSAHPERKSG